MGYNSNREKNHLYYLVLCCYNFLDLPWENVFQLWVGYFPRSRSLKTTSETSGFLSFKTLENSQRTVGKHLSTKNLENYSNRLLFLMYSLFSTILKAVKKILWLLVFREENFATLVFHEENFVTFSFPWGKFCDFSFPWGKFCDFSFPWRKQGLW